MKILILSCNTGEGHNSAGWAVKEYLELQGHQVVMEDMMLLKGARTSKAVGGAYVGIVKHFPLLFGLGYRLGGWVSSDKRKLHFVAECGLPHRSNYEYHFASRPESHSEVIRHRWLYRQPSVFRCHNKSAGYHERSAGKPKPVCNGSGRL